MSNASTSTAAVDAAAAATTLLASTTSPPSTATATQNKNAVHINSIGSRDLAAAPPPPLLRPHQHHHHHSHGKGGASPLKATLPMSSVLRGPIASNALLFAAATASSVSSSSVGTATTAASCAGGGGCDLFGALSPPPPLQSTTTTVLLRHVSPPVESNAAAAWGHRSPGGCVNYYAAGTRVGCPATTMDFDRGDNSCTGVTTTNIATSPNHNAVGRPQLSPQMRRTASLDALYLRPSALCVAQQQHQLAFAGGYGSSLAARDFAVLQLDKSTQTLESYLDAQQQHFNADDRVATTTLRSPIVSIGDFKIEKAVRQQRLQRINTATAATTTTAGGGGGITVMAVVGTQLSLGSGDHSMNSQTLSSPLHARVAKAIPMTIPVRPSPSHARPMRSSVEGLNQEIEKLVLQPDQPHTCRPETNLFSRGDTPEGHRAPLVDLLHHGSMSGNAGVCCSSNSNVGAADRRSVNTQTPSHELLSSDESQSTSPDDCASSSGTGASPRINRFLAREPPDGCEKVSLKMTDAADHQQPLGGHTHLFKPCVGFRLRPSLGSAFQPIVATSRSTQLQPMSSDTVADSAGTDNEQHSREAEAATDDCAVK